MDQDAHGMLYGTLGYFCEFVVFDLFHSLDHRSDTITESESVLRLISQRPLYSGEFSIGMSEFG